MCILIILVIKMLFFLLEYQINKEKLNYIIQKVKLTICWEIEIGDALPARSVPH